MGVADLKAAFNEAAPGFACTRATLGYEQANGTEWQRLTFYGTGADGQAFTIRSDRIRPHGDVLLATRETAARLLDQNKTPPALPPPELS